MEYTEKEYGLIIGRFQPFHYGHQHIVNEVLLDGKIPIICLGDDDGKNLKRNPLTFYQRMSLIDLIYPDTKLYYICLRDNDDWSEWFSSIGKELVHFNASPKNTTLYYNNKEQDRYERFEVNGREYHNEFYTKIFEVEGFNTKRVEFVERTDIKVDADATNIRENFEAFKHLLDARVYWRLKEWGW